MPKKSRTSKGAGGAKLPLRYKILSVFMAFLVAFILLCVFIQINPYPVSPTTTDIETILVLVISYASYFLMKSYFKTRAAKKR
jgi:hypothetical protein